jgi:predicted Zn-dependent protease
LKPLDNPDIHHLRAAQGGFELGNYKEALIELGNISPVAKGHLIVLKVEFQIFAKKEEWDVCRDIAEVKTKQNPDSAGGWLHLAYATRRATGGDEQAAFDILHRVAEKFSEEPTIPYNLACYTCQLGRLTEALGWLKKAFAIGNVTQLKLMALDDPDLEQLWNQIAEI